MRRLQGDQSVTLPLVGVLGRFAATADNFAFPVVAGGRYYLEALRRAGAAAVVVPPTTDREVLAHLLGRLDALVLPGGGDIDPSRYGQTPHDAVYNVDPDLDEFEFAAVNHVVENNVPTLAICRGFQVMNVALGGSLIQHMDGHRHVDHLVRLVPGTRVADVAAGRECLGRSFHHQGIDRLAEPLVATGATEDGVIEAVEHGAHPWFVGVQWHPEVTAHDDACQQVFFDELVRRAR